MRSTYRPRPNRGARCSATGSGRRGRSGTTRDSDSSGRPSDTRLPGSSAIGNAQRESVAELRDLVARRVHRDRDELEARFRRARAWSRCIAGISSSHGLHQVAQKFSSTTRPRSDASETVPAIEQRQLEGGRRLTGANRIGCRLGDQQGREDDGRDRGRQHRARRAATSTTGSAAAAAFLRPLAVVLAPAAAPLVVFAAFAGFAALRPSRSSRPWLLRGRLRRLLALRRRGRRPRDRRAPPSRSAPRRRRACASFSTRV